MKHIVKKISLVLICLSLHSLVHAEMYKGEISRVPVKKADVGVERCRRAQGSAELSINNVRARINVGGNMWFDGSVAKYYVPKDGNSTAMYAAALWIGGEDENRQLRVAALRFGQSGDDFWPGPLSVDGNAEINKKQCEYWDKHFRITKAEVERFVAACQKDATGKIIGGPADKTLITDAIASWPAHGQAGTNQSKYLAPFMDVNGDGEYRPEDGDYPYYDLSGELCQTEVKQSGGKYNPEKTLEEINGTGGSHKINGSILVDQVLKGDETLWWVFNDKGNAHTESGSRDPIGLEIRAQAFAFNMNDEINNMTFYSYEIINRSTFTLTNTYFSQWVDPDLGYSHDDFVGCDVKRGLGYCYNGKSTDGPGVGSYSGNPPAVGIDFFQGPYMDPDGIDNPKVPVNVVIDAIGEDNDKLKPYVKKDAVGNPILINGKKVFDTLLMTRDAELFVDYWYDKFDKVTNGANINGVNFGNGIVDDERFGMRRFVYYNNTADGVNGEPSKATDYYNYLRGIWRNNAPMTFGTDGKAAEGPANPVCDFMFPGKTDIWDWGTRGVKPSGNPQYDDTRGWTEESSNNSAADRRFMQSAGPFTLKPGAVNYITVGIPFAQATTGGPYASVDLLKQVDDKCQALFDNCFNILEGPDAPELTIQELDRELILYLTNDAPSHNNKNESYSKVDVRIPRSYQTLIQVSYIDTVYDDTDPTKYTLVAKVKDSVDAGKSGNYTEKQRSYVFEGYQIFQLKDQNVSIADIYNNDKARLVAQCDIKNFDPSQNNQPIGKLVNYVKDNNIGALVPQVMVDGLNNGIKHSFQIKEDKFALSNDKRIVNNKKYYYVAIAYAYNNFKQYSSEDATRLDGQKEPYLASRKSGYGEIKPVTAIPHKVESEQNGTLVQSAYGINPEITRIEGNGNGGLILDFKPSTIENIMGKKNEQAPSVPYMGRLEYQKNYGPLNIKVIDPLKIKTGDFIIRIDSSSSMNESYWVITKLDGSNILPNVREIRSDRKIGDINEQLILELGISITLVNPEPIVTDQIRVKTNYYRPSTVKLIGGRLNEGTALFSSVAASDPSKFQKWLGGIADNDGQDLLNWIRSGNQFASEAVMIDMNGNKSSSGLDMMSYYTQDYNYTDFDSVDIGGGKKEAVKYVFAIDAKSEYESMAGGWWAPYRLTATYFKYNSSTFNYTLPHPGFSYAHFSEKRLANSNAVEFDRGVRDRLDPSFIYSTLSNDLNNLASVDIVFTNDKTKWTRCPIIEMGDDSTQTQGRAKRFQLRRASSVDKNGNPDGTGAGMGWFPGYAINLETGQRLNIVFGENSQLGHQNGRDMLWNPTSATSDNGGNVLGGMHYIYVLGASEFNFYMPGATSPYLEIAKIKPTAYDEGKWAYENLRKLDNIRGTTSSIGLTEGGALNNDYKNENLMSAMHVFASAMWVGAPLANAFNDNPKAEIPVDVTVKLRVRQPYRTNYTLNGDLAANPQNKNYPMYQFSITKDIATVVGDTEIGKKALDLITVVPNPYFAASLYEQDQVQNLVKITNLPPDCYITIYSVDGTVIRKLRGPAKNLVSGGGSALTYTEWDLKNHKGLPISGGVYMIHIKSDVGEKVIKWFGALRPVDLNSFQ